MLVVEFMFYKAHLFSTLKAIAMHLDKVLAAILSPFNVF